MGDPVLPPNPAVIVCTERSSGHVIPTNAFPLVRVYSQRLTGERLVQSGCM